MLIVGTGVSAAISDSPTATWRGLVDSGLKRLEGLSNPALLNNIRGNVEFGFDSGDLATVLQAADRLRQEFDGVGAAGMSKWLSEDIGQLSPQATDTLGGALLNLTFPILTTNYDTLLSTETRRAVSWLQPEAMQAVMAGTSGDIGHLHGVWNQPESVILSNSDYERLLNADVAQMLQRSVSFLKSMVYVGYGSGLADPNFSRLIELHSKHFSNGQVTHFRLGRESDMQALQRDHAGDHIVPISYGSDYTDLPSFISQLGDRGAAISVSSAGIARDFVGAACTELSEKMIAESILADSLDVSEQRALSDVVLPPILLPVPHAEYLRSRQEKSVAKRVQRADPFEDAHMTEVLVLVGEEGSGLSTAANWMAYEGATHLGGAAPVSVSFRQVGAGPNPLSRLLQSVARGRGWTDEANQAMPPHILVLHDYSPYVAKLSDRAISDFAKSDAIIRILTCALGAEDDVSEKLKAAGVDFAVRYVGKLSSSDVEAYAKLASPVGYMDVKRKVIAVLTNESLPRTPLTVGLLVSVVVRGTSLTANASQTTVLDDYVGAMLGRGDPHEDARLGLDQSSREALLSVFAKHFVLENTGGVTDTDAVAVFEAALNRLSWTESPTEVLQSLVDRRVIRRVDGKVVFARSSFLHLFAAKRAMQDAEFRAHLLDNPLYYAPILGDYAAINRHDDDLVTRLNALLQSEEWTTDAGGVYSEIEQRPQPVAQPVAAPQGISPTEQEEAPPEFDLLDMTEDVDNTPFPTTQHETLPPGLRLMRVLELVSIVLRDSDQIEDGSKKREVLENVLRHWGQLMSTLDQDPEFIRFVREIGSAFRPDGSDEADDGTSGASATNEIDMFAKLFPAALAFGGVSEYLASRRLVLPLGEVVTAAKSDTRLELTAATAFMLFAVKEPGWVGQIKDLLDLRGNVWFISDFLLSFLTASYVMGKVSKAEAPLLRELCLGIVARSYKYHSGAERAAHRQQNASRIDAERHRYEREGDPSSDELEP